MPSEITKDPAAVLEYTFDWASLTNGSGGTTDWLASGETITARTVTVPAAPATLVLDSESLTDGNTSVTAWLSAGTDGVDYPVVCQITTDNATPRTDERTMTIKVINR